MFGTPEATAAYDRAVAEWLARGRAPDPRNKPTQAAADPTPGLSVKEILLAFWRHAEKHYRGDDGKPTSQFAEYRQTIRVVREWYGLEPAMKFGPLVLNAVRERMVRDGLSRAEVNRRVALARRLFKWAAGEELAPIEAYHRLTTVNHLHVPFFLTPWPAPTSPAMLHPTNAASPVRSNTSATASRNDRWFPFTHTM